jgi:hypothetical protein
MNGRAYLSTDGGATDGWPEVRPLGDVDAAWCDGAVGYDGQKLYLALWEGGIYRSEDGGGTWFTEPIAGAPAESTWGWMVAVGQSDDYPASAAANAMDGYLVFYGVYSPYVPPEPPVPGEFPTVGRFGIEGDYARLRIHEVEILPLPTESDYLDID